MKLHANARLSVKGRELLVDRVETQGWSLTQAAEAAGVSDRTARKWLGRFRAEGSTGLLDRSSAPATVANRTDEQRVQTIAELRRLRMTGAQIAEVLSMPLSTVSGILTRIGLGKRSRLEPPEPPNRYERRHPGDLIHIDVKKLGRIQGGAGHRVTGRKHTHVKRAGKRQVGWEYVHVCIDDATRLAYVEVLTDEKASTAIGFLRRALAFYAAHGIQVQRLMTDGCRSYVKQGMGVGALAAIVGGVVGGAPVGGVAGAGVCRSFQTRRARWRLRQRSASLRDLPSVCLRAR